MSWEKTAATFGLLDVLVNNAGTAIPMKLKAHRSPTSTTSLPSSASGASIISPAPVSER
jgi:NADP-dependent 3-hydroxy acid dehydrogenase YdfG